MSRESELRAQLMQLTLGYWRSQVLFTATELGVFDALREGGLTADEIARCCGSAPEATRRVLTACALLGLLEQGDGRFHNAPLAAAFLATGAPHYMGNWVKFMAACYRPWGELTEATRRGQPVADGLRQLGEGAEYTRRLILAMHEYALGPGRAGVGALDLAGRRRVLDVGGGAGSYSLLLARRYPELEAVIFDLPPVVAIAREVLRAGGAGDRVTVQEGNYLTDPLGRGYDVVLLSNMLHQEDPDTATALLRKARAALVDGGLLVIQLAFLNPEKDGPLWAVMQSIQLMLLYEGGRTYSIDETLRLVAAAGFVDARVIRASLISSESLIVATKA